MFAGLFEEEDALNGLFEQEGRGKVASNLKKPPTPRGSTALCGLNNLGATCYLNSILQTLHFTPEFREALFDIKEEELGLGLSVAGNTMVRAIPLQLQRLFARLLLLNQSSAEVTALTDSFGWTNSEEFQQHDVQELNRILFSAIESSLLGTSGEQLISKLYHGVTVQQITCRECHNVSEREEEFLDLPVALSGHGGLDDALKDSYIQLEQLTGNNQYFCSNCQKLVDASRGCHIRKLPSILTFALLRFLYDFKKGERYKDTSRFKFPMVLDMSPFCEGEGPAREDARYELFSVIIHSGSTHSGHYTAYIRDVDSLGHWVYPDEEPVQLPASAESGSTDLIDYDNPADLLCALLQQLGGTASISKLCKSLQDQTGVTWNKRFKKQFGPITTFMKSCDEVFSMSDTNHASLKQTPDNKVADSPAGTSPRPHPPSTQTTPKNNSTPPAGSRGNDGAPAENDVTRVSPSHIGEGPARKVAKEEEEMVEVGGPPVKEHPPPIPGECWFEFNDTHVSPILSQAIDTMFQGKKSAYMIFYRKTSAIRPQLAQGCPTYSVPERLLAEVAEENSRVEKERLEYEVARNTVRLYVHVHTDYHYSNGALHKKQDSDPFSVEIDKRKLVRDLKEQINECFRGNDSCSVMHTARFLPAGLHLYDIISDKDEASLAALDITNESHLFLWDGIQVDGEIILVGEASEPVQLLITYPTRGGAKEAEQDYEEEEDEEEEEEREEEVAMGFPKDSTLWEVRRALSNLLAVHPNQVTISQVKVQERRGQSQSSVVVLTSGKDKCTLSQLPLTDGDKLTVEKEVKKGVQTLAHFVADKQNKKFSFIVEDRVTPMQDSQVPYPVFSMEMGKDDSVATLRKKALQLQNIDEEVRFRVESDDSGIGPPLYETQTLLEAEVGQGQKVIMECGRPPLSSQISLQCSVSSHALGAGRALSEVLVDKSLTVGECCRVMIVTLGLDGEGWHLRKTNWCGEEAEILEDETATLEQEKLKPGELLLVEEGRLPPKGYIRLAVYLFTQDDGPAPPLSSTASQGLVTAQDHTHIPESDRMSVTSEETDSKVPLHLIPPSKYYPPLPGNILQVGSAEVSKDCTLEELKQHIATLPMFSDFVIPTPDFIRVRELVKGRFGKVFKTNSHSLRRLKFSSDTQLCCQILHYEEKLKQSSLLFFLCMRCPGERRYGPLTEVTYDTEHTPKSTSPHALRTFIADMLQVPLEDLCVAKHKIETFDWVLIEDSFVQKRGKKKGRGGQTSTSIKNSPIMLRDGDTIGCKDMRQCEDGSGFTTAEDDQGKAILLAIQEDKRKRRKAKEDVDVFGPKEKRQRRPECGIKIYVPDYRSK